MTVSMVAYLRKNFYLTEIVNEKIGIFHAAGLIDVWDRRSKIAMKNRINVNDDRKPLTLANLKGIFMIYLYACVASILCCVVEIVFSLVKTIMTERTSVLINNGFRGRPKIKISHFKLSH